MILAIGDVRIVVSLVLNFYIRIKFISSFLLLRMR